MNAIQTKDDGTRLIDSIERAEHVSLEAVRRFLDTVDGVFPVRPVTKAPVARSSTQPSR